VVFALDSIPAVLAITRDPSLVYTSNAFAMLGLRSLYFLLAGAIERFHALRYALGAILVFVSAKMLLSGIIDIPSSENLRLGIVPESVDGEASRSRFSSSRGTLRGPMIDAPRSPRIGSGGTGLACDALAPLPRDLRSIETPSASS
jgi:hypothetical protein